MAESTFAPTGAIAQDIAQESKLLPHLLLRWAGAWIDLIALALFLIIPDFLLGNEVYQATMAIWIGVAILYFPIAEGFWGRTAGKLVTGLIVVDRAGNPPGLLKAVVRTVLRLVEVNPLLLGGIPAAIAVVASKRRQRLGDMLARTYVVRFEALRPAISDPMPVERKAPDARSVLVFTIGPVSLLPAPGMQIRPRQLGARGAGRGKGPIAEFTADPAERSELGLRNLSDRTYRVTLPGGTWMDLGTGPDSQAFARSRDRFRWYRRHRALRLIGALIRSTSTLATRLPAQSGALSGNRGGNMLDETTNGTASARPSSAEACWSGRSARTDVNVG